MHPDFRRPRPCRAAIPHRPLLILCIASALVACAAPPRGPAGVPPPPLLPDSMPSAPVALAEGASSPPPPPAPPAAPRAAAPAASPVTVPALAAAVAYADRLRNLGPAELAAEQAQIGEPGSSPERLMQLALVLTQTHAPADTARALGLLQRLSASSAPEAVEMRPLARLLIGRLLEARRLEEQNDRLAQQLRDAQRRIDVLTDRLEAMRAIERSLTPRTPPPPGAPRPQP